MYGLCLIVYFTIIDIIKSFKSPFFILVISIIYYQYKKLVKSPLKATLTSIAFGAFGGVIATVAFIYLQVYIIPKDFFYIIGISMVLSLKDIRFMCISYGGSILVLISLIFSHPKVDGYEVMTIVAVLHMIESLLILINGQGQSKIEMFYTRGQVRKGLSLNRFWPIPFVVFIGDIMIKPTPLIAILSYGDFTLRGSAEKKKVYSSISLLIYSLILLYVSRIRRNPFIGPIFALLGHEFIIFINKYLENKSLKKKAKLHSGD